jgi:hypothetical protein
VQEFIDKIGKAAQQSASEAKLRLAVRTLGGKLDERAQALGYLLLKRHQGEEVSDENMLNILKEMVSLKVERQARESDLEALHKAPAATATAAPAAAAPSTNESATPPDAPPAQEQPEQTSEA